MPPLTFRSEDEEAQYCLSALRDGTHEEKIVARERWRQSSRGAASTTRWPSCTSSTSELACVRRRCSRICEVPPSRRPGERRGSPCRSAAGPLAGATAARSGVRRRHPPTPGVDSRVIPSRASPPPRQPEHAPAGAGSGSHPGLSAASRERLHGGGAHAPGGNAARADAAPIPAAPAQPDTARHLAQHHDPTWKRRSRQPTRNRLAEPVGARSVPCRRRRPVRDRAAGHLAGTLRRQPAFALSGGTGRPDRSSKPGADPPPMLKIARARPRRGISRPGVRSADSGHRRLGSRWHRRLMASAERTT